MTRQLLIVTAGILGLWLVTVAPATLKFDGAGRPLHLQPTPYLSLAAALICLAATLPAYSISTVLAHRSVEERVLGAFAGVTVRMFLTIALALAAHRWWVPKLADSLPDVPMAQIGWAYWSWVMVFYLATLALTTILSVIGTPHRNRTASEGFDSDLDRLSHGA